MKPQTIVNFSNICDDALNLFSEANHDISTLRNLEKTKTYIEDEIYIKTAQKCSDVIYSCISSKDQNVANIYHFDVVAFLQNIGVIFGDLRYAKKSHVKKIRKIENMILFNYATNPIQMFLCIVRSLESTGCIDVNTQNGNITRHDFNSDHHISQNHLQRYRDSISQEMRRKKNNI